VQYRNDVVDFTLTVVVLCTLICRKEDVRAKEKDQVKFEDLKKFDQLSLAIYLYQRMLRVHSKQTYQTL